MTSRRSLTPVSECPECQQLMVELRQPMDPGSTISVTMDIQHRAILLNLFKGNMV